MECIICLQEIEQRLLKEGFLFVRRCQTRLNRHQAEHFYSVHKGSKYIIINLMLTMSLHTAGHMDTVCVSVLFHVFSANAVNHGHYTSFKHVRVGVRVRYWLSFELG